MSKDMAKIIGMSPQEKRYFEVVSKTKEKAAIHYVPFKDAWNQFIKTESQKVKKDDNNNYGIVAQVMLQNKRKRNPTTVSTSSVKFKLKEWEHREKEFNKSVESIIM